MRYLLFFLLLAVPCEAQIVRADQFVFGTGGLNASRRLLTGAGSPESAVTAPVGSIYIRTDGGAGTTVYAKEAGSGNTGWSPLGAGFGVQSANTVLAGPTSGGTALPAFRALVGADVPATLTSNQYFIGANSTCGTAGQNGTFIATAAANVIDFCVNGVHVARMSGTSFLVASSSIKSLGFTSGSATASGTICLEYQSTTQMQITNCDGSGTSWRNIRGSTFTSADGDFLVGGGCAGSFGSNSYGRLCFSSPGRLKLRNADDGKVVVIDFNAADSTARLMNSAVTGAGLWQAKFRTDGPVPAVANVGASSCGTTAATIAGNDNAAIVTVGATSGTQCRVTFTRAAQTRWVCFVNNETGTAAFATYVDTTHVDLKGTFAGGDVLGVQCSEY